MERMVCMKQFIITAPDNITEATQYAESLASLAIMLHNGKMAVRSIEEIPSDARPAMKAFTQVSHEWPKE